MIRFSIVTVTYNAGTCLRRTTDSVLSQTYAGIEHLIIDGGSTDDTCAIAERYRDESARAHTGHVVKVSSEPDNGIYDAMNKGLRQAGGDYVCFLNAGDSLPRADTIETIVARAGLATAACGKRPAVIYGDTDIVDAEGTFLRPRRLRPPERLSWHSFKSGMVVCHQAFYALTEIAKATPYDTRYRYSADVDWCIRVMKKAGQMGLPLTNVHEVIANYTEEGQTTIHHRKSLMERFDVMRKHYGLAVTVARHLSFVVRLLRARRGLSPTCGAPPR